MAALVVSVLSDDAGWARRLEQGLRERGFDPLPLPGEGQPPPPPPAPKPLALLIDARLAPYGATELGEQLRLMLADRCPALLCVGTPEEAPGDDLFAAVAARPEDPLELLDELARLIPRVTGMESGVGTRPGPTAGLGEETG